MSLADELHKLDELRTRGVLSDDEFQRAKQRMLDGVRHGTFGIGRSLAHCRQFADLALATGGEHRRRRINFDHQRSEGDFGRKADL